LYLAETVCRLLRVASCKTLTFQLKSSNSRAYATNRGGSPSSRKSVYDRAFKDDEFKTPTTLDSKSSSRETLISLFKRIQIEISEGKPGSGIYSKSSQASYDHDSPVETSVLEFLQQSERETEGEQVVLITTTYRSLLHCAHNLLFLQIKVFIFFCS
ncbi:putative FAD-dependent monooxygenase kojA, partial [Bienertia sinuspersici]